MNAILENILKKDWVKGSLIIGATMIVTSAAIASLDYHDLKCIEFMKGKQVAIEASREDVSTSFMKNYLEDPNYLTLPVVPVGYVWSHSADLGRSIYRLFNE